VRPVFVCRRTERNAKKTFRQKAEKKWLCVLKREEEKERLPLKKAGLAVVGGGRGEKGLSSHLCPTEIH